MVELDRERFTNEDFTTQMLGCTSQLTITKNNNGSNKGRQFRIRSKLRVLRKEQTGLIRGTKTGNPRSSTRAMARGVQITMLATVRVPTINGVIKMSSTDRVEI